MENLNEVAPMATIKFAGDGQTFELPLEVAQNDDLLKKAVTIFNPGLANASITREEKDGRLTVTLAKQAGTKGSVSSSHSSSSFHYPDALESEVVSPTLGEATASAATPSHSKNEKEKVVIQEQSITDNNGDGDNDMEWLNELLKRLGQAADEIQSTGKNELGNFAVKSER